ncbi:MAG TPA: TonB-dependent receptor [Candidatus Polarisedimenticolia bacterium]|nr:TonB-dependent receptor [Candidatus Polarisedimenticolia bacterium]
MKRSSLAVMAAFALLFSFWTPQASSQAVFGSISGTVTDPSNAAVANAKVTVTDEAKGTTEQATTNENGNYTVTHLIPDLYTVRIEAAGFKVIEFKGIAVSADTGAHIDGQFQVGSTSEQVEVSAEAPQLKTDRADVSIEFNEKYVEDLPVMNRNFTSFELLSPGTQKMVGWSHAATENPQGSQQIFVNGQHFSGTAFELDGTDNQDPILGIIVVNPNLDAIQETKIDLQNYDAEFGKALGGVVTVQTKSGSNDFHGEGFWFRRTDATAARDPFTQYAPNPATGKFIPSDKWQQFGGTIGGPIIKNKLFFFGDYQATRESSGLTNLVTVPTALVESTCNPKTNTTGYCDLSEYIGQGLAGGTGPLSGQAYDPTTGNTATGTGRTPYPNNHIPIGQISPQAGAILALFPAPTTSGIQNNFVGSGTGTFSQNSFDTRIDYAASKSVQVFGRFSLDYFSLAGQGVYGVLQGVGDGPGGLAGSSNVHNYSLSSGVTKTFSSSLLGDFRFGYFKYNPRANKPDVGTTPMTNAGIPNANLTGTQALFTSGWGGFLLNQTPSSSSANAGANGAPTVSWGDGLGVGRCNCPLLESEQQFQWVGNITKIHGNHQFKFGVDVRYAMNLRVPSDNGRAGDYTFNYLSTSNGGSGGLDWATFMLGDVTQMVRYVSTSLTAAERQHRMFYYGQDTWRVTPKLTVNYGLRWEVYFPEYVNGKNQGGFANLEQGIDRVAGEGPYGLNGNVNNDWHYFAPRLGVAYQVNPKTVVRMGYGRSYDMGVFGSNFGHTVTQTLPVLAAQLAQSSTPNVAAFTLAQGPPIFNFPAIPSSGSLPVAGPNCYQQSYFPVAGGQNAQLCIQPHIRPTFQRLPELDAWNATVQRQLSSTTTVNIGYVGNKGTHIFAGDGPTYNVNEPRVGGGTVVGGAFIPTVPLNYRRPFFNNFTYAGFPDPTNTAALVPGAPNQAPGVLQCCSTDQNNYLGNDASSKYNAFQVELEKRFSHGLQVLSHYTFAHAYKYDNTYYIDDPRVAYGPDDEVRNHMWVNNVVYQLPFGRGQMFGNNSRKAEDLVIGGWQISGTTTWGSGLPWTPSFGECGLETDISGTICRPNKGTESFHTGAGSFNPITHQVPFFTPLPSILGVTSGSPFTDPGVGNIGNVGVFSYRGPRVFYADASILKNFGITERLKLQFRMDAFNVFNHPVLGFTNNQTGTGNCIDCSKNGAITDIEHDASPGSATGMRQLEFALKLMF